jgi:hypothetical protein
MKKQKVPDIETWLLEKIRQRQKKWEENRKREWEESERIEAARPKGTIKYINEK